MSRIQRIAAAGVLALVLAVAGHAADGPDRAQASAVAASVTEVAKVQQTQEQVLRDLGDRVKSQEAAVLEIGRKQVDWWIGFVGLVIGFLGLFSVIIPLIAYRSEKEKIQQDVKHVESIKSEVDKLASHARGVVKVIEGYRERLIGSSSVGVLSANREAGEGGERQYEDGSYFSGDPEISRIAATKVLSDKDASDEEKLLARAVLASLIDNPNSEQQLHAYELWEALTEWSASDGFAHVNAGERASVLAEKKIPRREGKTWLDTAIRHFEQAIQHRVPQPWGAYSNLGNCLARKASECVSSNETLGFELIEQAEAKYRLAVALKPDYEVAEWNSHVAANNFALAVLKAFATTAQLKDIPALNVAALQRAVRLLERHKVTGHDVVAFNLACLYAVLGDAQLAVDEFDHWYLTDEKKRRPDHPLFPVFGISRIHDDPIFQAWKMKRYPTKENPA